MQIVDVKAYLLSSSLVVTSFLARMPTKVINFKIERSAQELFVKTWLRDIV